MPRKSIAALAGLFAAALIITLSLAPPARATTIQWYVEVLTDPVSGEADLQARIFTRLGFRFHVLRRKDNSIWAEFHLPRSSRADLTTKVLPTIWIDDNDPIDLNAMKELELGFKPTLYKVDMRMIQFMIWAGAQPGFIPPILKQLMLGENLYVKYRTQMGEQGTAKIELTRANEAIAQFLKVAPLSQTEEEKKKATNDFALITRHFVELCEELRFSTDERDYSTCRDLFAQCTEIEEQTVDALRQCLDYHK